MTRFLTRKKDGRVFSLDRGNPKSDVNPQVISKQMTIRGFRDIIPPKELAKIRASKVTFVDVIKRNKEFPTTFEIPSKSQIKDLKQGDFAKLIFNNKERMWVIIEERDGDNFIGKLDNKPVIVTQVKIGDKIKFTIKNIASTMDA